jgi:SAM-dependent methyltransferase
LCRHEGRLLCSSDHRFQLNEQEIPLFDPPEFPRTPADLAREEAEAASYAGMRAFAFSAIGRGESEGLYRTVSDHIVQTLRGKAISTILDLGCGAGRTVLDCATAFPEALVVGADRSEGALTVAWALACLRGPAVMVDLRCWGFGYRHIAAYNLSNVFLVQANVERLPFQPRDGWPGFDAVTSVNLLDRVEHPDAVLQSVASVLRPGGSLILTTPLNWRDADGSRWQQLAQLNGLRDLIERSGLAVDLAYDGLVYRELQDARGAATDWPVVVIQAHRP